MLPKRHHPAVRGLFAVPRFRLILGVLEQHRELPFSDLFRLTGLARIEKHVADLEAMGAVAVDGHLVRAVAALPHNRVLEALLAGPVPAVVLADRLAVEELGPVLVDLLDGGFIEAGGAGLRLVLPGPVERIREYLRASDKPVGDWVLRRVLKIADAQLALAVLEQAGELHVRTISTGGLLVFWGEHYRPDDTGWLRRVTQEPQVVQGPRFAVLEGGRGADPAPRAIKREFSVIEGGLQPAATNAALAAS